MNTAVTPAFRNAIPADASRIRELLLQHGQTIEPEICSRVLRNPQDNHQQLWVLEQHNQLLACAWVIPHAGMRVPCYAYRLGTVVHASQELGLFNRSQTLQLSNDLTGVCDIAGLCLSQTAVADQVVRALTLHLRSRMADHTHVAVRLPGQVRLEDGQALSAFWDGLGRHFYDHQGMPQIGWLEDVRHSAIGELMPRHTVYASMLPEPAQAAIGQPAATSTALVEALHGHGFRTHGNVDIIDAGPIYQAALADLKLD